MKYSGVDSDSDSSQEAPKRWLLGDKLLKNKRLCAEYVDVLVTNDKCVIIYSYI